MTGLDGPPEQRVGAQIIVLIRAQRPRNKTKVTGPAVLAVWWGTLGEGRGGVGGLVSVGSGSGVWVSLYYYYWRVNPPTYRLPVRPLAQSTSGCCVWWSATSTASRTRATRCLRGGRGYLDGDGGVEDWGRIRFLQQAEKRAFYWFGEGGLSLCISVYPVYMCALPRARVISPTYTAGFTQPNAISRI